jgi:hypothetical protein
MANKEAIREWVDNLRSGVYKQGYGKLKQIVHNESTESHCCLGVATEIYMDKFGGLDEDIDRNDVTSHNEVVYFYDYEKCSYNEILPDDVIDWLDVKEETVHVNVDLNKYSVKIEDEKRLYEYENGERIYRTKLSELNDSGVDFEIIADIIEDNFLSD